MYAITGITGQVGGVVGRLLLSAGKQVRAVVRDTDKGAEWKRAGGEVVEAHMQDQAALERAFADAEAVFILLPPNFDPSPGFPETRAIVAALHAALESARPGRVVCLSTVGAQARQENLLSQLAIGEQVLADLPLPITFLRPAWFMENAASDIASARDEGIVYSFLQPLGRSIPMVATADVGRTAADLLQESWQGKRVIELEGPRRVSPNDIAAKLTRLFGRTVSAKVVPRDTWEAMFHSQGMRHPGPRMRMLDGFNEGWITFEREARKGRVDLQTVLSDLVDRSR